MLVVTQLPERSIYQISISLELFEIFRCHAEQKLLNNENSKSKTRSEVVKSRNYVTDSVVDLITMDVSRTFPSLGIFQKVIFLFFF